VLPCALLPGLLPSTPPARAMPPTAFSTERLRGELLGPLCGFLAVKDLWKLVCLC